MASPTDDEMASPTDDEIASFTDDELLDALRFQLARDRKFRQEIEEAVNSRWTIRLRQLIADVCEVFFGRIIGTIVDTLLSWFLS